MEGKNCFFGATVTTTTERGRWGWLQYHVGTVSSATKQREIHETEMIMTGSCAITVPVNCAITVLVNEYNNEESVRVGNLSQ